MIGVLVLYAILAFISGGLVKAADFIEDDLKSKAPVRIVLPLLYGLIIGFLVSQSPYSTIFLAALISQLLAGKIDNTSHRIGFGVALLSLFFFGMPVLNAGFLFAFVILAFLDESELPELLSMFREHRLFLPLGAVALIAVGIWDYAIGIVLFDVGYRLVDTVLVAKKTPSKKPSKPSTLRLKKKR